MTILDRVSRARTRVGGTRRQRRESADDLGRVSLSHALHHLAVLAIEGASDELAGTLDTAFELEVDGLVTDRDGYFALVEADGATHQTRPPLDVVSAVARGEVAII